MSTWFYWMTGALWAWTLACSRGSTWIGLWATLWAVGACGSFSLVVGSDPGWFTSASEGEEGWCEEDGSAPGGDPPPPSSVLVWQEGCEQCALPRRPLRSHHCKLCKRCVHTFDHHCVIIDTCIGEKNHARFYAFLVVSFGMLWHNWRALSPLTAQSQADPRESQLAKEGRMLLCFCLAAVWFMLASLLLYQTWLVFSGMTGYECNRGSSKVRYFAGREVLDLPFSRGLLGNVRGLVKRDAVLGGWGWGWGGGGGGGGFRGCCSSWRGRWLRWRWWLCGSGGSGGSSGGGAKEHADDQTSGSSGSSGGSGGSTVAEWAGERWELRPRKDIRDVDLCENLWANRYYTCC